MIATFVVLVLLAAPGMALALQLDLDARRQAPRHRRSR